MKSKYAIKPLEWKTDGTSEVGDLFFQVYYDGDSKWCVYEYGVGNFTPLGLFNTKEDAMAACEEHLRKYLSQYLIEAADNRDGTYWDGCDPVKRDKVLAQFQAEIEKDIKSGDVKFLDEEASK